MSFKRQNCKDERPFLFIYFIKYLAVCELSLLFCEFHTVTDQFQVILFTAQYKGG